MGRHIKSVFHYLVDKWLFLAIEETVDDVIVVVVHRMFNDYWLICLIAINDANQETGKF